MSDEKGEKSDYVLAEAAPPYGAKQGQKCCGGCCDMRRAVIIVNIVSIGFAVLGLISLLVATKIIDSGEVNDDQVQQAFASLSQSKGLLIAFMVIYLVAYGLGIYGGVSYNIWLVGIALVAYAIDFIVALIGLHLSGAVMAACFAYPHVVFIQEVKKGIMSKENYANEKFSCCCV